MEDKKINVYGKKILTIPMKKETVSKSGLIIVENEIDKNIVEASVITAGNDVSNEFAKTYKDSKIFYLKSNCIEIKLNDVLYHVLNEDDVLCVLQENK